VKRLLAVACSLCFSAAAVAPAQVPGAKTRLIKLSSATVAAALSPDGNQAATVGDDKKLCLWDAADGHLLKTVELPGGEIDFLAISPAEQWAVTGDPSGQVVIWDLSTGKERWHLQVPHSPSAAVFSVDGKVLALAPAGEPVQVLNLASGHKQFETAQVTGGTISLAFSRDGSMIAAADTDTAVRVYDAHSGKLIAENHDFLLEPLAVDFTSDGKQVLAAGADKLIVFIDASSGKLIRKLAKLEQPIAWSSLKVSPDGARLAAVAMTAENLDKPRPVEIWDLVTGQKQSEWMPPSVARAVAWTRDGRLVFAGGDAKTMAIWQLR
jgi:WD40 repeat protein